MQGRRSRCKLPARAVSNRSATVTRIFARNGVAFEMLSEGRIVRVLPPVLGEDLKRTLFRTGDRTLDNMLEECRTKFSDRNPLVRREAPERLWDAWERLKSFADPGDKKMSVKIMLGPRRPPSPRRLHQDRAHVEPPHSGKGPAMG